ncbi:hypothetical protein CF336_g9196 [Tilletia laevis]|nr:hypothetical protein CF336_g9196 [Tilletia laevis]
MSSCKRPATITSEDHVNIKRVRNDNTAGLNEASIDTQDAAFSLADTAHSQPSPTSSSSSASTGLSCSDGRLESNAPRGKSSIDTVHTEAPVNDGSLRSSIVDNAQSPEQGQIARLSLSPFRPSEAPSPSAAPHTPQSTIKVEPVAAARPEWIAPVTWRPVGRYIRVRNVPLLGQGSNGEVARVLDALGGSMRARKRVSFLNSPPRSLLFEIKALTRLQGHKGITELIDICYTTHKVDLIMPIYWGCLQDLFDQAEGRGLVTSLAKNLTLQLLVAVSYIHRQGLIHLDITPGNLMLTRDCVLKVGDFGIAALAGHDEDTRTFGTFGYTAPECLLGSTKPTCQADVWWTGCVIAHLFLDRPLFAESHDAASSIQDILHFTGHPGGPVFPRARFSPSAFDLPMDWPPVESQATNILQDADGDAADVVEKMLCLQPNRRPHLATFFTHCLFSNSPPPNRVNPMLPRINASIQ